MAEYYKEAGEKEVFTIQEARTLAEGLNKISAKFGLRYKVERCSMTTAKILKEIDDGGIISKKRRKIFKKRSGGC
jgi:hypothetical protein